MKIQIFFKFVSYQEILNLCTKLTIFIVKEVRDSIKIS